MTFNTLTMRSKFKSLVIAANIQYAGTNVKIVLPNEMVEPPSVAKAPFVVMSHALAMQTDGTLAGNERLEERGVYDFAVHVRYGSGEKDALPICEQIKAVYPSGSRFTFTGGVIQIPETPTIRTMGFMGSDQAFAFVNVTYIASSD